MKTGQLIVALTILLCRPGVGLSLMTVEKHGNWPSDWPAQLEPYRDRAETWTGPIVPTGPRAITATFYEIPFSERTDFEKAWRAFLEVKSDKAPLTLRTAAKGSAIVRVRGWFSPKNQPGYSLELHVDGQVIDLNRIRLPADTDIVDKRELPAPRGVPSTQPAGKQAEAAPTDEVPEWGPAREGVQCRLRAEKAVWPAGQWPKFRADLRNRGDHTWWLAVAPSSWKIAVDGVWYHPTVLFSGTIRSLQLAPGEQETDIPLQPAKASRWRNQHEDKPLAFEPGKHTVSFALRLTSADEGPPISVASNPVEIVMKPVPPANAK